MGLTLVAILTAALLLPGIIASRCFYLAAQTSEVEVPVPALSTPDGIALIGGFSVVVHFAYVLLLKGVSALPLLLPLPLADPYALFSPTPPTDALAAAYALFSGLAGLGLTAALVGFMVGWLLIKGGRKSLFYGPLGEVIESGHGDDRFITAYVITKIGDKDRLVGYQGTVVSLFRDDDRYPSKVVLKDVVPFYLAMEADGPKREESAQAIDWLVLSSSDWHNIAFRVFRVVRDEGRESEADMIDWQLSSLPTI